MSEIHVKDEAIGPFVEGPLVALIHEVARLTSLQVDAALRPYHLTRAQLLTLMVLDSHNGAHQTDIALRLRMGRSAVGKLLDRLEAAGYIRREHDPYDARAVRVFMTPTTRDRLREISSAANTRCAEILTPLGPEERAALNRALLLLRDHTAADPALAADLDQSESAG